MTHQEKMKSDIQSRKRWKGLVWTAKDNRTTLILLAAGTLAMSHTWILGYLPQLRSKTHPQFLFHLVIGVIRILFSDVLSF